jgi:hypothetical protein
MTAGVFRIFGKRTTAAPGTIGDEAINRVRRDPMAIIAWTRACHFVMREGGRLPAVISAIRPP